MSQLGNLWIDIFFMSNFKALECFGHVNILRAINPGLVYDIQPQDYLPYLCGLGYTDGQVGIIVRRPVRCSEFSSISETELNYPSFSVVLGNGSQTYNRRVTNVGEASSVYTVGASRLSGVDMRVEPTTLMFSGLNKNLTYQVTYSRSSNASSDTLGEGYLTWTSDNARYSVISPIVVLADSQS